MRAEESGSNEAKQAWGRQQTSETKMGLMTTVNM